MNKKIVQNILDFLLGVSWAIVLLGAFLFFTLFSSFGLIASIIAAFFGMVLGFILIAVFESIRVLFACYEEIKQQNIFLKEIKNKMDK